MKQLLLLRHAKAVPAGTGIADHERPLAERGHRDAASIGAAIAADWPPDLILCSPALRTIETTEDVAAAFPQATTTTDDALYGGSVTAYLDAIARRGGVADCVLVVGHNPAIHEAAMALAKSPGVKMEAKFPTCALAVLSFDIGDWADIGPGAGTLVRFLRPKDLAAKEEGD